MKPEIQEKIQLDRRHLALWLLAIRTQFHLTLGTYPQLPQDANMWKDFIHEQVPEGLFCHVSVVCWSQTRRNPCFLADLRIFKMLVLGNTRTHMKNMLSMIW